MDSLYVVTLMIAIAAVVVAILISVIGLVKPNLQAEPNAAIWRTLLSHCLTQGSLGLGAFSLSISVVIHSQWGHGTGTVTPMNLRQLLSEHEAFPAVGAMLLFALLLAIYRSRRQRHASAT